MVRQACVWRASATDKGDIQQVDWTICKDVEDSNHDTYRMMMPAASFDVNTADIDQFWNYAFPQEEKYLQRLQFWGVQRYGDAWMKGLVVRLVLWPRTERGSCSH